MHSKEALGLGFCFWVHWFIVNYPLDWLLSLLIRVFGYAYVYSIVLGYPHDDG